MKLVFLGTSSAIPTRTRNVSGLAIGRKDRKAWTLIDCGEGTQHQILRTDYALSNLSAIFITHVHGDHCYGLPGLLTSASMEGRTQALPIIAPMPLQEFLRTTFEASAVHLGFPIEFVAVETLSDPLRIDAFSVTGISLSHRVPSYAFRFIETDIPRKIDVDKLDRMGVPKGEIWGRLQRGEDVARHGASTLVSADYLLAPETPRAIVVAGDNDRPELLGDACAGANLLVHEATYTESLRAKRESTQHSSALRVAQFAESIAGLENLILTHFSARYQSDDEKSPCLEDIRAEALKAYSGNLFLAGDLQCYWLGPTGKLTMETQTT